MKSVFDPDTRSLLLARVERVTADSRPQWGKMNAEQMLTHLVKSLQMATGEVVAKTVWTPVRYTPLRQLIVYLLPWPKNVATARELLPSNPVALEEGRRALVRVIEDIAARSSQREWPEHPAFGPVGRRGWGVVAWRHVDHHLRQFGV
jgi:hypothetical protein